MDDINRSQTVMVRELIITERRNGDTDKKSKRILKATQTRCVLATSFGSLSTHLSQQREILHANNPVFCRSSWKLEIYYKP